MPQFKVVGANKTNGRDVEFSLEAASVFDATDRANEMGIAVRDVEPFAPVQHATRLPPPSGPTAPPSYTATVNMVHRRSNSLGIASLVLGIIALLACWIPFVNVISIFVGGLGLALGAIGIILAISRSGYGVGFAIAGTALSGLSLIIAIVFLIAIASAVNRVSNQHRTASTQSSAAQQNAR